MRMANHVVFSAVIFLGVLSAGLNSLARADIENHHVLTDLVRSYTNCSATRLLQKSLPHTPLFKMQNGSCVAAGYDNEEVEPHFADSSCRGESIPFRRTDFKEYCDDLAAPYHDRLGNAASWASDEPTWTLNPAGRLDLSTLSIVNNHQPYMTRLRYKSVQVRDVHLLDPDDPSAGTVTTLRGIGQCDLEMRVLKKDPFATGLKPLLAIHGGAWILRGSPYVGFESELSHFTEQGFVVFAPFYRLSEHLDGNFECNHAPWQEIVSDAEDALEWVKQHGAGYGADVGPGKKIYLMGGSAGGHLVGWLSVHKKEDVARTLMFYPPTDFRAYIQMALDTEDDLRGEQAIEEFLDLEDVADIDLASYPVTANSFTDYVVQAPDSYPPVAMIHGVKDTLVPSIQSVRLCNAYNGDVENGPAKNDGGDPASGTYSKEYGCGSEGKLFLIAEGDHTLDACVEYLGCPAGGEQSQQAVSESMVKAIQWLNQ